jgi:hypothetical protein
MPAQDDEQQRFLLSLHRRAAARQIDRRAFLRLAMAGGIEAAFAEAIGGSRNGHR